MSNIDDEYALFQAEMQGLFSNDNIDSKQNETEEECDNVPKGLSEQEQQQEDELVDLPDIENELNYLKGHKCQAPYNCNTTNNTHDDEPEEESNSISYHNALVISVHTPESGVTDINEILVKVVFTHPLYKSMLTCPYYLEGDCKYSQERCHYSHGYLVKFIKLKEYKDVCFDNLTKNQIILAKNLQNNIWYRAKIVDFNLKTNNVVVKFETGEGRKGYNKNITNDVEMDLENIYPLDNTSETFDTDELEVSEESEDQEFEENCNNSLETDIEISLNNTPLDTKLGDWEKYTKGMGSKLMLQMGYVIGTGLGKHCKGRIEPVETLVLPQGKSLDYCMNLKEKYGNNKDLFNLYKINKRKKLKQIKKSTENYKNAVRKEKSNIFNFMNRHLNPTSDTGESSNNCTISESNSKNLKPNCSNSGSNPKTNKELNMETFKISEQINKYNKQLSELNKSLKRHENGSDMFKKISREISLVNNNIDTLRRQDSKIHSQIKKQFNIKDMVKF